MAAASSQSARDRNGPLLARATCPWWRTRARTRSLICLPASVCQLARSNVIQSCSFRRVFDTHRYRSLDPSSVQWRELSSLFSVHVQSDSKGREEQEIVSEGFWTRLVDLESFVYRFEAIWRDSPFSIFGFRKNFEVMCTRERKRIFEDFFWIVEESLLFVFNIYVCIYIYWYTRRCDILRFKYCWNYYYLYGYLTFRIRIFEMFPGMNFTKCMLNEFETLFIIGLNYWKFVDSNLKWRFLYDPGFDIRHF